MTLVCTFVPAMYVLYCRTNSIRHLVVSERQYMYDVATRKVPRNPSQSSSGVFKSNSDTGAFRSLSSFREGDAYWWGFEFTCFPGYDNFADLEPHEVVSDSQMQANANAQSHGHTNISQQTNVGNVTPYPGGSSQEPNKQ